MAERSGFFNALRVNGEYDRKYNANDYTDNLAVVISNGVLRSVNDDLHVRASGMVVSVGAGRAWIDGHYYYNDSTLSFAAVTAPAGGSRWDRVMLRLDNAVGTRSIKLRYAQGTAADSPTKPAPVRSGDIYELVLADIYVGTNATSVTVTDMRADDSLCGWVFSTSGDDSFFTSLDNSFAEWFSEKKDTLASVTLFKRYNWRTVLAAASATAIFDIPQWDEETTFLEVYVNGVLDVEGVDYTRSGSTLTFANSLIAGTEIVVKAYKSIDGTGIESVSDEITQLQNDVAVLANTNEYTYICNGVDDNVKLSEIAQAWLNGGTDYSSKTIKVYGNFGATAAYSGGGTSTSPYVWFRLGSGGTTNRRVIFDFSSCSQIAVSCPDDSYNIIFFGLQVHVIGANVVATGGAEITMFSTAGATQAYAENCRFWITSGAGYIARGGVFRDCRGELTLTGADAFCFNTLSGGLLRLYGGEYYAYAPTGNQSAVVYVNSAQKGAVVITNGISCPTAAVTGFVQSAAIRCWTSDACCSFTDTITTLEVGADGQNIRGTIAKSKAGMM